MRSGLNFARTSGHSCGKIVDISLALKYGVLT
jgi:hypothetical protein